MLLYLQLRPPPAPNFKPPENPKSNLRPFAPLRPLPPPVLSSSSATSDAGIRFREKLVYLENDLYLDSARALALNPDLRAVPISSIAAVSSLLSSHGLGPVDAARILSSHPSLLTADPSEDLLPVIRFLLGPAALPFPQLRTALLRCPRLLVSSVPDQLRPALYFLRRLGFPPRLTPHTALLLVSSVECTLLPKVQFLQSLGFSYRETTKMVLRCPGLLTCSIENNFRPKVEFLMGEMGRDVRELKEFPQYFSFSLEGKIKPRHRMLTEHGFYIPLAEMLKVSDGEFTKRLLEMQLRPVDEKL